MSDHEQAPSDSRPPVLAQTRFQQHRQQLEPLALKDRFAYIYDQNLWGCPESRSGLGSTLDETEALRRDLSALWREYRIRSLLDIPCGDFGWLSQVAMDFHYTGVDIVPALIAENTRRYASPTRQFLCLDLTADALPRADLVLCRDCLVHLSDLHIRQALNNLRRSGSTYALLTHFPGVQTNRDVLDGDWRPLNFERPPFSLPRPERILVEHCQEANGAYRDKSLGLWRVADLPA